MSVHFPDIFIVTSILRYRGLIFAITLRDIKSRYSGATFGALWLVLPPMFMVFIYTVVFSRIMHARLPGVEHQYAYSIYLCAGLMTWNLLLELVQRGKGVFLEHANLIKKASFPKFILFIPVLAVALFNCLVLFALVLAFMYLAGYPIPFNVLFFIPIFGLTLLLGTVVGALLATLNVFFRDIGQLADIVFQALFWATPIVYPFAILPERVQLALEWNPLLALIRTAQNALLGDPIVVAPLLYPLATAGVVAALFVVLYQRSYADLLDQL